MTDYFIYLLRDINNNDNYTGISTSVDRRLEEHNTGKGAKRTSGRMWMLVNSIGPFSHSFAAKEEYKIKKVRTEGKKVIYMNTLVENL